MKQFEAIEKITEIIKKDNPVRAIFLKGSIARNDLLWASRLASHLSGDL